MTQRIGIWIDHKKAVMVPASGEYIITTTETSDLRARAADSGSEKRSEQRHEQQLDRYFDEVISRIGQPEALLILGPGEAKLQLRERLSHSKALSACVIGIETADKLTDRQIAAKVKEYYLTALER